MPAQTMTSSHVPTGGLSALSLGALGVVYGDIGTSPLYTLKIVLEATGTHPAPEAVLGALSLIVWTLIIITTVKYIGLALRMDNEGEGGILALMALLSRKPGRRLVLLTGMFGAALVYGDCALTPAISVLSALEGLDIIAPELDQLSCCRGRWQFSSHALFAQFSDVQLASASVNSWGRSWRSGSRCWHCSACGELQSILPCYGPVNPAYLGLHFLFSRWWRQPSCGCSAACSFASPGPRRCMPTSAISAGRRSRLGWCVVSRRWS